MKLILIHGAPAVGKLTVAKALIQATSSKLFDNHAAIDAARTVFEFDEPGFWDLVRTIRLSVLKAAAEQNVPLVVMTSCYSAPEDTPNFEQFESVIQEHDGEILPAYLYCSEEETIRRVGNADRVERGKITTEHSLKDFNTRYNLTHVPRENCLILDSEIRSAEETAQEIISHFDLY